MKKFLSACLALVLLSSCVTAGALVGGQGFGSYNVQPTPRPSINQRDFSFPSTEPESVTVTYNKTDYTVSLISVGLDEHGMRTVNVSGLGYTLPTRNGERIAHIRAEIKANGFTYEWNELLVSGLGVATFLFGTNAYPEKLLLYSYDNSKRKTLTLNAEDAAAAAAAEYEKSQVHILDDYRYTVDADGKATVTGYPSSDATVTIPSSLDGYPVVGIDSSAFFGHMFLKTVKLPSSMRTIGDGAFGSCLALQSVNLPARLQTIGAGAFNGCSALESIYIQDNVESIGPSAFAGCSSLKSIKVSSDNRVYYAKSGVLFHRKDKELVAYPAGKTAAEYGVPEGTLSIAACAFAGCKEIMSVSLPDGLLSIGNKAFDDCHWLKSVNLPEGLQSVGSNAFSGCALLASVSLPESLLSVGERAFCDCTSLQSIEVAAGNPVFESMDGVLVNKEDKTLIAYPAGKTAAEYSVAQGVQTIADVAFQNCTALTSVSLPDGVQSVGIASFLGCSSLTSVSLPDSVQYIGYMAFCKCSSLTDVSLPDGLIRTVGATFESCTSLTSVSLPDSLQSIGSGTFEKCSSLMAVDLPDGLQSIDYRAFAGCTSLATLSIPASVKSISTSAFENCPMLTLTVPRGSYAQEYAETYGIPYQFAE